MTDSIEDGFHGVRLATKADEDQIFALLSLHDAETSLFTLSVAKVRAAIQQAIQRRGGMIGVIELDGRLVATIGLFIEQPWHSDDWMLQDRWNFVHPDFRRSDYAKRLVAFSKRAQGWFEEREITMPLVIGVFSGKRTEAKVRLYRRWFTCVGAVFVYGRTPRQPQNGFPAVTSTPLQQRSPAAAMRH